MAARENREEAEIDIELEKKIDLSKCNTQYSQEFPGIYPSLANKIIQNAPYNKVEDLLQIPRLSKDQKQFLQANLYRFIIGNVEHLEGDNCDGQT